MKPAVRSPKSTGLDKPKRPSKAFERLSADFGPSAKRVKPRQVGAVALLLQLRHGEA